MSQIKIAEDVQYSTKLQSSARSSFLAVVGAGQSRTSKEPILYSQSSSKSLTALFIFSLSTPDISIESHMPYINKRANKLTHF
jgi:hypothetical protein